MSAYAVNAPGLWRSVFSFADADSHKYMRGHALIAGGDPWHTGAARLAAYAALRSGAGLVSVACTEAALPIYAAALMAVMTKPAETADEWRELLEDKRIHAALIGPGAGISEETKARTLALLAARKPCVIDADALTAFEDDPNPLLDGLHGACVLTPHAGEFLRLFAMQGDRLTLAREAARRSGAVVVLKGADTIVAAPEGRAVMNNNAPPWLATAGSGDVLAGMITALLAQGMPAFEAACAGVWLHGEAANASGYGMIAEDLTGLIPKALRKLI